MQCEIGARGEHGIDGNQVLHRRDLGRQHDAVGAEAELDGPLGAQQRRLHDRLMHHFARVLRLWQLRVLVHQPREQILIEASPVHADPHRLAVLERDLDDLGELPVALVLEADIAGIDAVFGKRLRASRMLFQQRVAVIVEVADQRRLDAENVEPLANIGNGCRGLGTVDGDAHQLGAGARQRRDLGGSRLDIGRVGIGHRLDDDGGIAAQRDVADPDRDGAPARRAIHKREDTSDFDRPRQRGVSGFPTFGLGRLAALSQPKGKIGKERGGGNAGGAEQRGREVRHAVRRQSLQGFQQDREGHEPSRHCHRPRPGEADDQRHGEISEEMLGEPMQPEPDLQIDRHQRVRRDRHNQNGGGNRRPFRDG